jgi:hypothetical protein
MELRSVSDIVGPWVETDRDSGLIERCRAYWSTPISELPDIALATFLEQRIAIGPVMAEARRRVDAGIGDGSEFFDGQLAEAVDRARSA